MSGASHIALSVLLIGGWSSWLEAPNDKVAKGNEQFEAGAFDSALEQYRAAAGDTGDPAAVRFDEGAALYRLAEGETDPDKKAELLAQAEQAFRRAAEARDPELKSAAYYNLGNALYQVESWDEAVRAYKKALLSNPRNDNARYNLELAQRQRHRDAPPQPQNGQGQQGPPQPGQDGEPQDQDQGGQQDGDQGQEQSTPDGQGQAPQGDEPQQQPSDGQDQGQGGEQPEQGDQQDPTGNNGDSQSQGDPGDQGDQGDGDQGDGDQGEDPSDPNADRQPGDGDAEAPSEVDRKLDALERMSRDLRHQNLRGGPTEAGRGKPVKDW